MQHEVSRYNLARGVAALVVFVAHLSQVFIWPVLPPDSWFIYAAGISARAAVLAFFVLSGLLITKSIIGNVKRNGYFDPIDYLTSRIARIYPPFILALAVTIGVAALIGHFGLPGGAGPLGQLRPGGVVYEKGEVVKALLLYGGLTGVNGPLWTLYIEVKLYLLAMGVAMVWASKSAMIRIAGGATVGLVAFFWVSKADVGFWFFAAVWTFGASLNIGRRPYVVLSGAALILYACAFQPFDVTSYIDGSKAGLMAQAFGCIIFAFAYLLPRYAEHRWNRYLIKTADYSYTLYVMHFPLLALGLSISIFLGLTSPLGAALSLAVTAAATLSITMMVAPFVENDKRFKLSILNWTKTKNA